MPLGFGGAGDGAWVAGAAAAGAGVAAGAVGVDPRRADPDAAAPPPEASGVRDGVVPPAAAIAGSSDVLAMNPSCSALRHIASAVGNALPARSRTGMPATPSVNALSQNSRTSSIADMPA